MSKTHVSLLEYHYNVYTQTETIINCAVSSINKEEDKKHF